MSLQQKLKHEMGYIIIDSLPLGSHSWEHEVVRVREDAGSNPEWLTPCDALGRPYTITGLVARPGARPETITRYRNDGETIYHTRKDAQRAIRGLSTSSAPKARRRARKASHPD